MNANLALTIATLLWGFWGFASQQAASRAHFFTVQLAVAIPWALSVPLWYVLRSRLPSSAGSIDPRTFGWATASSVAAIVAMLCFVVALRGGAGAFGVMCVSVYPVISLLLLIFAGQERLSVYHVLGSLLVVGGLFVLQMAPKP